MLKYFAGIGSREAPQNILDKMSVLSYELTNAGYTLRSGHAEGADYAFEKDAQQADIYLPWSRFNYIKLGSFAHHNYYVVPTTDKEAFESVSRFHPKPSMLSPGAIKLMARNYRQIVGQNGKPNSEFVICWTKNGEKIGGTAQAIKIAESFNIPVYNLFHEELYDFILENKT